MSSSAESGGSGSAGGCDAEVAELQTELAKYQMLTASLAIVIVMLLVAVVATV